ncbi:unnamed protein product [Amoebophrya sp. A25]|nr:unnamed protein product [Amoebophrya sp. A25]|eukprot:GSA25T00020430001.1
MKFQLSVLSSTSAAVAYAAVMAAPPSEEGFLSSSGPTAALLGDTNIQEQDLSGTNTAATVQEDEQDRAVAAGAEGEIEDQVCPPASFDSISKEKLEEQGGLRTYISDRWFIQEQMPVAYLGEEKNFCVSANYTLKEPRRLRDPFSWFKWGYEIGVSNYAETADQTPSGGPLCAKYVDEDTGKLKVAPCFLPPIAAGAYWVLDYDEEVGYALVSGGPPKDKSNGKCKTKNAVFNSGLWIFTRCPNADQEVIDQARNKAEELGFDLSVLKPVLHHKECRYGLNEDEFSGLQARLKQRQCAVVTKELKPASEGEHESGSEAGAAVETAAGEDVAASGQPTGAENSEAPEAAPVTTTPVNDQE